MLPAPLGGMHNSVELKENQQKHLCPALWTSGLGPLWSQSVHLEFRKIHWENKHFLVMVPLGELCLALLVMSHALGLVFSLFPLPFLIILWKNASRPRWAAHFWRSAHIILHQPDRHEPESARPVEFSILGGGLEESWNWVWMDVRCSISSSGKWWGRWRAIHRFSINVR